MNQQRSDFLTTSENAQIARDVRDLLDDPEMTVSVTYRQYVSRTLTAGTGGVTPTYNDTVMGAQRGVLGAREVQAGGGLYRVGDVRFMLDRADYVTSPSREDRIVAGAETYEIVSWDTDPLSKMWNVVARRVK